MEDFVEVSGDGAAELLTLLTIHGTGDLFVPSATIGDPSAPGGDSAVSTVVTGRLMLSSAMLTSRGSFAQRIALVAQAFGQFLYNTGNGQLFWDVDGTEYVDLHGGYGVSLVGHAHPALVRAVTERVALAS